MVTRDKLLEEYKREYDGAVRRLFLSRCHTTEQGVKKINECQIPSIIEILMEMRSSGTLSNVISSVVKDLIDQIDSSIQAPVAQKSVIEKPTNNPCKSLPDVAGQTVIRPSQTKFVDQKSPRKSTETISSISTLRGQQNKGKDTGCTSTGLTGLQAGLTSPRDLQNKLKPKMYNPKKLEIGIWKTIEFKSRHKRPTKFSKQKDIKHASWAKNSK